MLNWFDIETTGLNLEGGHLLEVGCIITDDKLNEVARMATLIDTGKSVGDLRLAAGEYVREMHGKSGLWKDLLEAKETATHRTVSAAERGFLSLMQQHGSDGCGHLLAGSSVHFDRTWLRAFMPELESEFHYRNFDVSTLKEAHKRFCPDAAPFLKEGNTIHRVLADLEYSIAELRHYLVLMGWDGVLSTTP